VGLGFLVKRRQCSEQTIIACVGNGVAKAQDVYLKTVLTLLQRGGNQFLGSKVL
jgi:hypothetical protein